MKNMIKANVIFSITFIALAVLSYVEEIFHLHIPMFRWVYAFSAEERMLYRLQMVIVPIFYLCVLLPISRRSERNNKQ